jgi:hypothetical protein
MAKSTAKTTENDNSVLDFIKTIPGDQKQKDSLKIIDIMKKESGFEPKMWGPAIVGFGSYHYKYESGREGDAPLIGFSPRKEALTIYLSSKFDNRDELLKEFGKHKTSKACIYVKKIDDINIDVLKKMVANSLKYYKEKYP